MTLSTLFEEQKELIQFAALMEADSYDSVLPLNFMSFCVEIETNSLSYLLSGQKLVLDPLEGPLWEIKYWCSKRMIQHGASTEPWLSCQLARCLRGSCSPLGEELRSLQTTAGCRRVDSRPSPCTNELRELTTKYKGIRKDKPPWLCPSTFGCGCIHSLNVLPL